jgi:hypothetical protein
VNYQTKASPPPITGEDSLEIENKLADDQVYQRKLKRVYRCSQAFKLYSFHLKYRASEQKPHRYSLF